MDIHPKSRDNCRRIKLVFIERHLLADVLESRSAPLQELSETKAVFIEAPAITKIRYGQEMLDLVTKVHDLLMRSFY